MLLQVGAAGGVKGTHPPGPPVKDVRQKLRREHLPQNPAPRQKLPVVQGVVRVRLHQYPSPLKMLFPEPPVGLPLSLEASYAQPGQLLGKKDGVRPGPDPA